MKAQEIYNKSPYWLQVLALNLFSGKIRFSRHGSEFKDIFNNLLVSQFFTQDQIIEHQNQRLSILIKHAYETVPYYNKLFRHHNLHPNDIQTIFDLPKIPILEKKHVIEHAEDLISSSFKPKQLAKGVTSGTTGSPLTVAWDNRACIYNDAVDWRQKHSAGIKYQDKMALLLGRQIVPSTKTKPPYWVLDHFHNQLWMSAFHLNENNLPLYVAKLRKFKPRAIEGYPSTLYVLADYMRKNSLVLPVDAVFTSSETLYPIQREVIESAFEAKITDYYGMAERVIFATECENHVKHINFDYCIAEVVDKDNRVLPDGEDGMLVGTSLVNYGMPFIRYKTTDISNIATSKGCSCGRSMNVMADVTTKAEDIILRLDGTRISPSILTHSFKPLSNILKSQIIQETKSHIIIKIVRNSSYSDSDSQKLISSLKERIGEDMTVTLEFVSDIPRTKSGKYRWVISNVGNQFHK